MSISQTVSAGEKSRSTSVRSAGRARTAMVTTFLATAFVLSGATAALAAPATITSDHVSPTAANIALTCGGDWPGCDGNWPGL
jgi:hypothetical protein